MMSSSIVNLDTYQLAARVGKVRTLDVPSPVILLSPAGAEMAGSLLLVAAQHHAQTAERPFDLILVGTGVISEPDTLACMLADASDLALFAGAPAPNTSSDRHVENHKIIMQRSLASLLSVDFPVLAIRLSGKETATEMNTLMSLLHEPQSDGLDLTKTQVFWCAENADTLPQSYRNGCEVFSVSLPAATRKIKP